MLNNNTGRALEFTQSARWQNVTMGRAVRNRSPKSAKSDYAATDVDSILDQIDEAIDAKKFIAIRTGRGRPSLTGSASVSPHVGFRLTPQMRTDAEQLAEQLGMSVSELARRALAEYLAGHTSQSDMLAHHE